MIQDSTILVLIDEFCQNWENLKNPIDSIEKKKLLKKLALNVRELCKVFAKRELNQELLFAYLLNTVWGAPFVFEQSLRLAASQAQQFKALMNHMLQHSDVIDKEIQVAKEQCKKYFSQKKSA